MRRLTGVKMNHATAGHLEVDVAIIGAGPAGLTAGYLLSKQGKTVAIIEKDDTYVGGISRTVEHGGYRFDVGGHRFFSKNAAVVDLWNEILPDGFIQRPQLSRIYYQGKFYSYPMRAFEALSKFGIVRSTACMASYLRCKLFSLAEVKTFEDWTTNRFGRRLYLIFFKTYAEKVWGVPCDEISADWAAQRIGELSLWSVVAGGLRRSMGLNEKRGGGLAAKSMQEISRYPRLGAGMMWDAARARIVAAGGTVLMGRSLEQLASDGAGGWRMSANGPGGKIVITAQDAISSAPMRELAARLHPLLDATLNAAKLKYRDFLTVALKIRSDDLFPDNWIYIHDPQLQVGRVQNFRNWSPEMVPDKDVACVGLEYFCFEGDGLWASSDDDLIALATREMKILGLCDHRDVIGGAVVRQAKAYPVYDEGYAANVEAMRQELETKFPSLHLVGRNGMHCYDSQDRAMLTAMLTTQNILAGKRVYDTWCVNQDAEYHEAGHDGADAAIPARETSQDAIPASADHAAALHSLHSVAEPIAAKSGTGKVTRAA